MIRWIVGSSLRLSLLVVVAAAAILVYGITQLRKMPVDVFPEFNPPLVEVQTEALGLSAAEVESLITVPTEADLLNGVAWLDQIYSESVAGMSSILMVFEPGTDPIRARQMVQERLTQAYALPNVSKPPVMLQPLSASSRAMMVGLSSEELSLIEMGVLVRWNIKPRLMGVPGVANVAVWGQRERQLQMQVDPERLHDNGVTLAQIIKTAGEALWVSPLSYLEASTPGTAGWIDTPTQRLSIRHLLPISSPEELAKVAVVDTDGLLLGDVTNVVEEHQPLIGDATLDDRPGYLLVIEKFPGASTEAVTRGVEEALDAMRPGLTGIEIDTTVFRPANYIESARANVSRSLLIGALLVLLLLLLFQWDWRSALIGFVAIPLSLVVATFVLYLRGATFNAMVLAGLAMALGAVIDDAMIDVENITRRLRQHRQEGSDQAATAIILSAALEMRSPVAFATLILVLAVTPILFLQDLAGAFFRPLAVTYLLAVLASLATAMLVTPVLSMLLLGGSSRPGRVSPVIPGLQRVYRGLLARTVGASTATLVAAAAIILIGLAALPFLERSLLPAFKQTDLLIQLEGAPGTSRLEMARMEVQVSRELRSIAGVRNVGSHVGRAETGDQVVGINSGELWASLDPAADYDQTVAAIRAAISGYPGLSAIVQTYQPERLGQTLTSPDHDITVRIYGHDLAVLRDKAQEVRQAVAEIDGVVEARTEAQAEEPQLEIEVDLAAAERHRVIPGDVRRQATTLLSGLQVGTLFEEQKVFEVVVWGVPEIRNSLSDIRGLPIETPLGLVRLDDLADVRIVPTPVIIRRDAVSRFVDVDVSVQGRRFGAVAAAIDERIDKIAFPMEFHAEVLGDAATRQAAWWRVWAAAL
ncbi:MAG: acriflavin resistance protein, partial [Chloroflexi bacterium]